LRTSIFAALAVVCFASLAGAQTPAMVELHYPPSPDQLFPGLFPAVQSASLFADSKLFADAVPTESPDHILARYRALKPNGAAQLKTFVETYFRLPAPAEAPASPPEHVPIVAHIDALWDELTRKTTEVEPNDSLLPLPQPYVVPGGRFREIYYWDSYFTMLGLEQSGRQDLVRAMIEDFAFFIDTYGHIPNGARSYYLSRSQPPFFFRMVALLSPQDPAAAFARYLPQLRREHAFWMDGERQITPGTAHRRVVALRDGSILNRYWDDRDSPRDESYVEDRMLARTSGRPAKTLYRNIRAAAESGWDFSSRWFEDAKQRSRIDTTEIVPVDLNSLLYGLETAISAGCDRQGDGGCTQEFARRAAARRSAIDRHLWSASRHVYVDYRWTGERQNSQVTAATLYPLFVAVASQAQARAVAATVAHDLLEPGGIVTTKLNTGEQWDSPNGWAPLQWLAVEGFKNYGEDALAAAIACRWIVTVDGFYAQTGKLIEKYDVIEPGRRGGGGEYPTQDGFGWTNGVMRKLLTLYPADAALTKTSECPAPGPD
jgi:alpha,alpha-trehalase